MFNLNRFPRELCLDNIRVAIANNMMDVVKWINQYNGLHDLHTTVYPFETVNDGHCEYQTAIIDKVYMDVDDHDDDGKYIDAAEETLKLIEPMERNEELFSINFSGRGTHVYAYVEPTFLKNPAYAVMNYRNMLVKASGAVVDMAIMNEERLFARETRLLNTINMKSGLYCIPLEIEDLEKGMDWIKSLARQKRPLTKDFLYGKYPVHLQSYDGERIEEKMKKIGMADLNALFVPDGQLGAMDLQHEVDMLKDIPCMAAFLADENLGYQKRTMLLQKLKYDGLTAQEGDAILRSFLSATKYNNSYCVRTHAEKIINYYNYRRPTCYSIDEKGWCPMHGKQFECKYFNKLTL